LKPDNIFINDNMIIKIGDFGISNQLKLYKEYTLTKNKAGTEYYIAPEISDDGIYNEKSDIWSLGCIIYELFNLSKYYNDREYDEIKAIDSKKYNNKWQGIINSLLQINYNDRMNINQVCGIILNEMNINELERSIFIKNIEYKIIKELGKGTFGRVVEVEKDNKYYAIKEIKIEGKLKDKINEIQIEVEILSKFDNKNIVKFYDSYLDKDKFYILYLYILYLDYIV